MNAIGQTTMIWIGLAAVLTTSAAETGSEQKDRDVPTIKWDTTINKFQFDRDKFLGQRLTVKCPPAPRGADLTGVYGTDYYPSESSICVAALHAGEITTEGGTVTVQLNPGGSEYTGSDRNGVKTLDLPATKRSLSFVDDSSSTIEEDHLALLPRIDWDTKFTRSGFAYRHLLGQRIMFRCPPMPKDRKMRLVYGTDTYDFSSYICQAALHAGTLTTDGGIVTVQIESRMPKLVGSIRNGVETKSKSGGDRTISFVDRQTK